MSAPTFASPQNVSVSGGTITKNGGSAETPDAGGVAAQTLAGDGSVSYTVPATTGNLTFGLSTLATWQTTYTGMGYAFNITNASADCEVRESGTYRSDFTYNVGDVLTISRVGTTVTYKRNGTTLLTSGVASSGTLYLHVVILTIAAALTSGDITGSAGGSTIPTLGATTATTQTAAPTSYPNALSDRSILAMPTLANRPAVASTTNGTFTDPFFHRTLTRVTTATTNSSGKGWRTSSSEQVTIWGRGSDRFHCLRPDGSVEYFTVSAGVPTWVRTLANFNAEPTWSRVTGKEHLLYGTTAGMLIKQYNSNANTYSTLLDLSTIDAAYTGGSFAWGGSIQSSASSPERLACFYGGTSQDTHFRVLVFDVDDPTNSAKRLILDTKAATINGVAVSMSGYTFKLHAIGIDQSGRYVILYPTNADIHGAQSVPDKFFWDLQAGTITPVTIPMFNQGHDTLGYGFWVNQDGDISGSAGTTYDAWQWAQRQLGDLTHPTAVIAHTLTPALVNGADDHPSYGNARSDVTVPFITATDRAYDTTLVAWRAWDAQILAVHPISGAVYRFCYTWADTAGNFWYQPIAFSSPNGRYILFDSNMLKTLGTEPGDASTFRTDLFLIDALENLAPTATVPTLVGLTQAAAGTALTALGLVLGTVTTANSSTVPTGQVISQGTTAGTVVALGTAVTVVVSLGPVPAPVIQPQVTGSVSRPQPTLADSVTPYTTQHIRVSKGDEVDFSVYRGARRDVVLTLTPVEDISGRSLVATIRNASGTLVGTVAASLTDPTNGVFTFSFDGTTTDLPPGVYSWDGWRVDAGHPEVYVAPSVMTVVPSVRKP